METLIKAIDKAVRAGGVYTLEEVATILNELNKVGTIVEAHNKALKAEEKNKNGNSKKGSDKPEK